MPSITAKQYAQMFAPKPFTLLRGDGWSDLRADTIAGLTVTIAALPLATALAIASGTVPEKGLYIAIDMVPCVAESVVGETAAFDGADA